MKIPSIDQAEILLEEAAHMNPGRWVEHSRFSAKAAYNIAASLTNLDPSVCYTLGLLHDIGRREGVAHMRHIFDGYKFLIELDYDDAARICLTHSFPYKDTITSFGRWDCTEGDLAFINTYLQKIQYDDYDRLIQLCDYLALPTGFCLVEKRMIDVALRYGTNHYAVLKWKSIFEIKQHFESTTGRSIYSVLPGIVDNTFEWNLSTNSDRG